MTPPPDRTVGALQAPGTVVTLNQVTTTKLPAITPGFTDRRPPPAGWEDLSNVR